jgi:hypothetical protein
MSRPEGLSFWSALPEEIYVLCSPTGAPLVAHTRAEGATTEMANWPPDAQEHMRVTCVRLVNDDE